MVLLDWMVRRVMLDAMALSEKKGPTDFLAFKERLEQRGPKEELVIQESLESQDPLESQVFLVRLASQERGGYQGPEESQEASDQWGTLGLRE